MKKILIVLVSITISMFATMNRDNNGIVTDSDRQLQWQDSYADNTIKKMNWKEAIEYCETLVLGGKSDWRLPNINELLSIVDYNKKAPAIKSIFKNTKSDFYWSSTTYTKSNYTDNAWRVLFYDGSTNRMAAKSSIYNNYTRCVRSK